MSKQRNLFTNQQSKVVSASLEGYSIIILTDMPEAGLDSLTSYLKDQGWESEKNVYHALKRKGYQVSLVGIYDHFAPLVNAIKKSPDPEKIIIFNLCESMLSLRQYESHVASLLEMLGIPYTGNSAECLALCRHKAQAKAVVDSLKIPYIHVPKFRLFQKSDQHLSSQFFDEDASEKFIVKPLNQDGSVGISTKAVVQSEKTLKKRVEHINRIYDSPALVVEFIDGREIYISVIGNEYPQALPPREFFFGKYELPLASYHAKWNEDFRKKWKIRSGPAQKLNNTVREQLESGAKMIYRALGMRGYGRIDFRLNKKNEIYFLEANPNPCIESAGELARSANKAGLTYIQMLEQILFFAQDRSKREKRLGMGAALLRTIFADVAPYVSKDVSRDSSKEVLQEGDGENRSGEAVDEAA